MNMILPIMRKKIVILVFLILGVAAIGKSWHWAKDGFNIRRTYFPLLGKTSEMPTLETVAALSQPYRYLGRGHQCYAFESADRRYVFKLPRYDRYTLPFWLRSTSFPFLKKYREELRLDKQHRLQFLLNSFQIAFDDLREETALVSLHFHETENFSKKLQIQDRLGRSYSIDLDRTAFVLQRKIPLMMPIFQKSLAQGDKQKAEEILTAFLEVIAIRAKKGIFNKDPSFLRNFGYEDRGFQIDIGSFYRKKDQNDVFGPSFLQTVGHVQNWLSEIDPEIAAWFQERTNQIAAP